MSNYLCNNSFFINKICFKNLILIILFFCHLFNAKQVMLTTNNYFIIKNFNEFN
jgi:hypothetical protein